MSGQIARIAQQMYSDLREAYPMYAPGHFSEVEVRVHEIVNAPPPQNDADSQLLVAKLGEVAVAIDNVRQRLDGV